MQWQQCAVPLVRWPSCGVGPGCRVVVRRAATCNASTGVVATGRISA